MHEVVARVSKASMVSRVISGAHLSSSVTGDGIRTTTKLERLGRPPTSRIGVFSPICLNQTLPTGWAVKSLFNIYIKGRASI